jgi:Cytochrome P460
MKLILCCSLVALSLTHAAPTDAELLDLVKNRTKLERVTPEPKQVSSKFAGLCRPPTPAETAEVGKDPHQGGFIHVYTSDSAVQPYFDPWGKFPEGSLVLKEKLTGPKLKTDGFTGMIKREAGYFPAGGDWEYFTVDGGVTKLGERGKIQSCAECHAEHGKGDRITKLSAAAVQITGGRIMLHSSKSTPHGEKLQYEEPEKKNTLGFWVNPADWAEWKFNVAQPGTYTIHLWQGCGKGSGGAEIEILCGGQSNKFIVEDTGHFQNFKEREVGTVTFAKAGPQTLELHARTKPGGAVMDCRQIILVPKKP